MAIDTSEPFIWGNGGEQLTPGQIAARRKVAEQLMQEAGDYSPIRSPWQGVARVAKGVMAGFDERAADQAEKANRKAETDLIQSLFAGGQSVSAQSPSPATPGTATPPMGSPALPAPSKAPASTSGKIYEENEPSPLDPPSGEDRVKMIATILGEAASEPQLGKQAVASVIRNRAVNGGYGGDTVSGVVTAPNQFEPWNTQEGRSRMARATLDPKQYEAADAAIRTAYGEGGAAPEDPTGGMTHFFSPGTQAALGRQAPAWAGGPSVTIGGHVFNAPDGNAPNSKPVQVASASPVVPVGGAPAAPAPSAVERVAQAAQTPAQVPMARMLAAYPYLSEGGQKVVGAMLAQQMKPQEYGFQTLPDGTILRTDPRNGTVTPIYQGPTKQSFGFQTLPDGTIVSTDPRTGDVKPVYQGATKPNFGVIGEDPYGNKTYGFIDPAKGKVTPYQQTEGASNPGTVTGPDGKPVAIPQGADPKTFRNEMTKVAADVAAGKKTEVQAKAEMFANSMEQAERILKDTDTEGGGFRGRMLEGMPLVGNTALTNPLQTEKYQQYKQARDKFITSLLREESGAAIGTQEFQRYERELFPQPGDAPSVVAQKREARRVAIEAMKKAAGPSYKGPTAAEQPNTTGETKGGLKWSVE